MQCGIKIEFVFDDIEADALERKERGVSFVHVKNFRINAERGEGFDAANPEHHLLPNPHFEIAAVKLGGDKPILGVVFGNVGIEKVKSDAADVQLPNFREDFAAE